jgi:putative restriction endonuclease
MEKGWPPLTSIVLNKDTGQPGSGFIAWPGDLDKAHRAVFAFEWAKIPRPFSEDFQRKLERAGRKGRGKPGDNFNVPDQTVTVNGRGPFQARFRQMLLNAYDWQCALCETNLEKMLVACHIIPWSSDRENRLNPQNGILLCRTPDCLFDSTTIRIAPDGVVWWPSITKTKLGRDLFRIVTKQTYDRLRMPKKRVRPSPVFLQWRLDNLAALSALDVVD